MRSGLTRSSKKKQAKKEKVLVDPFERQVCLDLYLLDKKGNLSNNSANGLNFALNNNSYYALPSLDSYKLEDADFTLECLVSSSNWFTNATAAGAWFFAKGTDYYSPYGFLFFYYYNLLVFAYSVNGQNIIYTSLAWTPTNNVNYYLGIVRKDSVLSYFVNGVLLGDRAINGSISHSNSTPLTLGNEIGTSTSNFIYKAARITKAARNLLDLSTYPIVNIQ